MIPERDWAGNLPRHWSALRFRFLARLEKGRVSPEKVSEENGGEPCLTTEYLRSGVPERYVVPSDGAVLARDGDLLLLWDGSNAGEFFRARSGVLGSTLVKCSVSESRLDPRFAHFAAKAMEIHLQSLTVGMGIPHVDGDILNNFRLPVPPLDEQRAIVGFLDRETARIDGLIEKKRRQIELLHEKRAALISHTVTKGLDPTAPMKDSGVEWLGEVPQHWNLLRLKYSADLVNEKVNGAACELPYTGLEHIESWTGKRLVTDAATSSDGQASLHRAGDVLFGKLRPYLAKAYVAENGGICTSELLVLRPKAVLQRFLRDYLLNPCFISVVDSSTYGAKMPRASWEFIGSLPVLVPPPDEQHAIVRFLDRETARIDALIEKKRRQIELLHEKRAALISAAVTGKIDVRKEVG